MGHWLHECRSNPKKEQVHNAQDEEEGLLILMTATLTHLEVSSTLGFTAEAIPSGVYAHLVEEERDAGTWLLHTGATNHMFGCWAAFRKLNTTILNTVHFGDDFEKPSGQFLGLIVMSH
jgi:hypothetical protein